MFYNIISIKIPVMLFPLFALWGCSSINVRMYPSVSQISCSAGSDNQNIRIDMNNRVGLSREELDGKYLILIKKMEKEKKKAVDIEQIISNLLSLEFHLQFRKKERIIRLVKYLGVSLASVGLLAGVYFYADFPNSNLTLSADCACGVNPTSDISRFREFCSFLNWKDQNDSVIYTLPLNPGYSGNCTFHRYELKEVSLDRQLDIPGLQKILDNRIHLYNEMLHTFLAKQGALLQVFIPILGGLSILSSCLFSPRSTNECKRIPVEQMRKNVDAAYDAAITVAEDIKEACTNELNVSNKTQQLPRAISVKKDLLYNNWRSARIELRKFAQGMFCLAKDLNVVQKNDHGDVNSLQERLVSIKEEVDLWLIELNEL